MSATRGLACLLAALVLTACGTSKPVAKLVPAVCTTANANGESVPQFRMLGEIRWDVDTSYGGVPVGGLSSIDWDAARGEFLLVSDDRGTYGAPRYYSARMELDARGLHSVWLTGMQALPNTSQLSGAPDAEALRVMPGTNILLWTSEGDFSRGFGPALYSMQQDGSALRTWPLPNMLQLPADRNQSADNGPRRNFTLEGLALSNDGRTLWLAMEGPLKQDGRMPSPGHAGAPVRITALDAQTGQPLGQLAYQPDALPGDIRLLPHRAVNGVSEILADGPEHLLVLERSFMVEKGWRARIYRIRLNDALNTNTLDMQRLEAGRFNAASKQLLIDFADLPLRSVDNIEGMTWGPVLPGGERVLVLVSDNNFNPAQATQFIALAELPACKNE